MLHSVNEISVEEAAEMAGSREALYGPTVD